MNSTIYISFLLVSFGLIIVPGPNVLVIVSTSLMYGRVRGFQTVAGTTLAMILQLAIVGTGTSWFILFLTDGFYIIKWIGVAYLLYLSFLYFKHAIFDAGSQIRLSVSATFTRGFLVSLTNPKTILFFSAFFPQFISSTSNYLEQFIFLSLTFTLMAAVLDFCYVLLASRFVLLLKKRNLSRLQNGLSGFLLLVASGWLATFRRIP